MSNAALVIVFGVIWAATFFPAWYLLGKLVTHAASPNTKLLSGRFIGLFVIYEVVIALPYIPLLLFGDGVPDFVRIIAGAAIAVGVFVSFARFFLAKRIEKLLWGVYGYVYDGLLHFYPYQNLLQLAVGRLEIHPSDKVLDLGCGSGNASKLIAEKEPAELTCVDASKSMMRPIHKKLKSFERRDIIQSDALSYIRSAPDQAFNKVIMINVLYAISDRQELWNEIMRITTDSALIVMTSSDKAGSAAIIKEHLKNASFWSLLHPRLLGVFIVDALISSFANTGVFHFISKEEMVKEIKQAGGQASKITRCYGGEDNGVNLIMNITKS